MELKPGYKQTEAGVMPEDWEDLTVEELKSPKENALATGPFGSSIGSRFFCDFGVPIIRGGNLSDDSSVRINDSGLVFLSNNKALEFARSAVHQGDLVFTCWGTINQIGLIDGHAKYTEYIISNKQMKLTPDLKKTSSLFLYYLFSSSLIQTKLKQNSIGSSVPGFNLGQLRAMHLTVPLLPEQRAIAAALSDTDALLSSLDRLLAKKCDIKQAIMQQLLTGKQRLPGFSGEWEVKRLGDVVEKIVGGGTPSRSNPKYWGNEVPWMTVKDFATFHSCHTQESITYEGLISSASHLIPKGILITSTRMALGQAVIYKVDVSINQDLKAIFPRQNLDSNYLYHWFKYHSQIIDALGSGSTVKGISLSELRSIKFYSFPVDEQTAIAAVLSDMDAEIDALQQRRDKTRAVKQGMMQELLTGRTRLI